MQASCTGCGQENTFTDPADEGWQYDLEDVGVRFRDDGSREVTRREGTRRIFWRCTQPAPTENNPFALCHTDNVVEEAWGTDLVENPSLKHVEAPAVTFNIGGQV